MTVSPLYSKWPPRSPDVILIEQLHMIGQEIHKDVQVTNLEQLCDAVQSAQIKNKLKIIKAVLNAKAVQMGTRKVLYCCIIFIHIHSLTRAIQHAKGKSE